MNTYNKQKTDLKAKVSYKTTSIGGVNSVVRDSLNESKNQLKQVYNVYQEKSKAVTQNIPNKNIKTKTC